MCSEMTITLYRMVSSGMLRRVTFVRTDVLEEISAYLIRVTRIGELGTTLAVSSNRRTLRINTNIHKPGVPLRLTVSNIGLPTYRLAHRATRRNIPEDTILHSHRRENLKSYTL
jgi:hypothetical protein